VVVGVIGGVRRVGHGSAKGSHGDNKAPAPASAIAEKKVVDGVETLPFDLRQLNNIARGSPEKKHTTQHTQTWRQRLSAPF
jgi:hypothetical protein